MVRKKVCTGALDSAIGSRQGLSAPEPLDRAWPWGRFAIHQGVTMSAISQVDSDFAFLGAASPAAAAPQTGDPLGPLADLPGPGDNPGTWTDSMLNLAKSWHAAESGVLGDSDGTEAICTPGTDIEVRAPLTRAKTATVSS
jgi:hypothetical protein